MIESPLVVEITQDRGGESPISQCSTAALEHGGPNPAKPCKGISV